MKGGRFSRFGRAVKVADVFLRPPVFSLENCERASAPNRESGGEKDPVGRRDGLPPPTQTRMDW